MTNAWKAEGSLDARHTEANMAALREIELDTLQERAFNQAPLDVCH